MKRAQKHRKGTVQFCFRVPIVYMDRVGKEAVKGDRSKSDVVWEHIQKGVSSDSSDRPIDIDLIESLNAVYVLMKPGLDALSKAAKNKNVKASKKVEGFNDTAREFDRLFNLHMKDMGQ